MKRVTIIAALITATPLAAQAQGWTNGYERRDGTYVQGYEHSQRDNTVTNNYSFSGNSNPYTGETGHNRYEHNTTSPYYSGPSASGHSGHSEQSGMWAPSKQW